MPLEKAIEKNLICLGCTSKATNRFFCQSCRLTFLQNKCKSVEVIVMASVGEIFGQALLAHRSAYFSGPMCANNVQGSSSSECKTEVNRTFIDLTIIELNYIIHLEVDEHRHDPYEVSCEIARYDRMVYSQNGILKKVIIIRFNPHDTEDIKISFIIKLKSLLQILRNIIDIENSRD